MTMEASSNEEEDTSILEHQMEDQMVAGDEARLVARREVLALRAKMTELQIKLKERQKSQRIGMYQREIKQVFANDAMPSPYVLNIQSQLCQVLHKNEVQLRQIKMTQKRNKKLISYLQKESEALTEENAQVELRFVNELAEASAQKHTLIEGLKEQAGDQEEEIKQIREERGLSPDLSLLTPVSPRKNLADSFGDLMGSLRHLTLAPLVHTPEALKKSKVWADANEENYDDVSDLNVSNHYKQREQREHFKRQASIKYGTSLDDGSSSHSTDSYRGMPSRSSMVNALSFGSIRSILSASEHHPAQHHTKSSTNNNNHNNSFGSTLRNSLSVSEHHQQRYNNNNNSFGSTMRNSLSTSDHQPNTNSKSAQHSFETGATTKDNSESTTGEGSPVLISKFYSTGGYGGPVGLRTLFQPDPDEPMSPTSAAMKSLADEVYSY